MKTIKTFKDYKEAVEFAYDYIQNSNKIIFLLYNVDIDGFDITDEPEGFIETLCIFSNRYDADISIYKTITELSVARLIAFIEFSKTFREN